MLILSFTLMWLVGGGGLRNISIIYKRGDLYFPANKKTNQNMLVLFNVRIYASLRWSFIKFWLLMNYACSLFLSFFFLPYVIYSLQGLLIISDVPLRRDETIKNDPSAHLREDLKTKITAYLTKFREWPNFRYICYLPSFVSPIE